MVAFALHAKDNLGLLIKTRTRDSDRIHHIVIVYFWPLDLIFLCCNTDRNNIGQVIQENVPPRTILGKKNYIFVIFVNVNIIYLLSHPFCCFCTFSSSPMSNPSQFLLKIYPACPFSSTSTNIISCLMTEIASNCSTQLPI